MVTTIHLNESIGISDKVLSIMNTYSHMRDDLTVRQRAVDDAATAIEVFTRQANSNASVDFSGNSAFPVISTFVSDDMRESLPS